MGLFDLFKKKTSPKSFEEIVGHAYGETIKTICQQYGDDELAGVFLLTAIHSTYESLRTDKKLLLKSGLSEPEYEEVMKKMYRKMCDTYLKY